MNRRYLLILLLGVTGILCYVVLTLVHVTGEEWAATYKYYKPFSRGIAKCHQVTLYEGLPHQMFEKDLFGEELGGKKTIQIGGFPFYAEPITMASEDRQVFQTLFTTPSSFSKLWGVKQCGGFHPDYCITWEDATDKYEFLICFGCHEMKTLCKDKMLYADVSMMAFNEFKNRLQKYRKQRPEQKIKGLNDR